MSEMENEKTFKCKIVDWISVILCFLIIVILGILSWALPQKTYSEYEKRDLAQMPEFSVNALFNGSYTKDVENSYSDTFAFRDLFVKVSSFIDDCKGIQSGGTIYSGKQDTIEPSQEIPLDTEESTSDVSENEPLSIVESNPSDETSSLEELEDDNAVGETIGGIFIYKGVGYELLGGSESTSEYYASVINKYREMIPSNVKLYNMVVPKHAEFALPKKYKNLTRSAKDCIDLIYGKFNPGINGVDAYSYLSNHSNEYIYFNTDHHWTGLGAYYGYQAFCESAGFEPRKYDDYIKHKIDGFLGTLYSATLDKSLEKTGDYVEWCEFPIEATCYQYNKGDLLNYFESMILASYAKGVNAYGVYLGGDWPLTVIKTDNGNGRKCLIIKESYGNALSTYIAAEFEETYVVDERYFEGNIIDLIEKAGITDVLIVNNVSSANTKYHIANIESLLTNKYDKEIVLP